MNTLMSSFLNEFKLLINLLISLLTKVISSLLGKKNVYLSHEQSSRNFSI